jgi:hypothetical protein
MKISVFPKSSDEILDSIQKRIRPYYRVSANLPNDIPSLIEGRAQGLVLDLIGHNHKGYLRFGETTINTDTNIIDTFQKFAEMGVTTVRLLGCETANGYDEGALQTLGSGLMTISVSYRDLNCNDYNHAGLRPTAESSVFNHGQDSHAVDPPFRLTELFDEYPVVQRRIGTISANRAQIEQLERLLEDDYQCCCLKDYEIIKTFEMPVAGGQVGRASLVKTSDGSLLVVTNLGPVEVAYKMKSACDLIASW